MASSHRLQRSSSQASTAGVEDTSNNTADTVVFRSHLLGRLLSFALEAGLMTLQAGSSCRDGLSVHGVLMLIGIGVVIKNDDSIIIVGCVVREWGTSSSGCN